MSSPTERTVERIAPTLSTEGAAGLLAAHWDLHAVPEPLPSYADQNFRVTDTDGERWVLKIANTADSRDDLDFQNAVMARIAEREPGLSPRPRPTSKGTAIESVEVNGHTHHVRLLSYVDGALWRDAAHESAVTWRSLGSVLGRVDRALDGIDHPAMHRRHDWDLKHADWIIGHASRFPPERARRLAAVHVQFLGDVKRVLGDLPSGVIYNDANRGNVTVRETPAGDEVIGVFDFGDVAHTARVFEVAIAAAYAILDRENVLEVVREVVRGYHDVRPLVERELDVVFPALAMRLAVSVTSSEAAAAAEPDNAYIRVDQRAAWDALERLASIMPAEASSALRSACGFDVVSERTPTSIPDLIRRRRRMLAPSLSLSYDEPLDIVTGRMQYLFDTAGRAYLDGVNNVCHVGHCHPRVVEAATKQIEALNTNTRYLHDDIVRYAERLAVTLPDPLAVCLFVNSGTEANELALRMARTFTGRRRVLAIDHGYHGHSTAMVDLSSYKHDGPGGAGKPEWLHRVPCPDPYRGRYTGRDAAERYASHVAEEMQHAAADGDDIAAFFAEPILGCGGQIVPPPGYLAGAFERARAGGAVCVADEVQIGFGRVGRSHVVVDRPGCGSRHRHDGKAHRERTPDGGGGHHPRDRGRVRQRHGVLLHVRGEPRVGRRRARGARCDRSRRSHAERARRGRVSHGRIPRRGDAARDDRRRSRRRALPRRRIGGKPRSQDAGRSVVVQSHSTCAHGGCSSERRRPRPQCVEDQAADVHHDDGRGADAHRLRTRTGGGKLLTERAPDMAVMTKYEHGQFNWVDLMAHDPDAAARFYGEVFGWTSEEQDTGGGPPYWIFKLRDHQVAGMGRISDEMKAQGVPQCWNNYINVDDCAAAEKTCVDNGGTAMMPTMQVMDVGWMTFITDPTGANFALWQKNRHIGSGLANEPGAFSWNELATRDLDKAKEFYANVFGWTYELNKDTGGGDYFIASNKGQMACGLMEMTKEWPAEVPPHWSVYFSVENADETTDRIKGERRQRHHAAVRHSDWADRGHDRCSGWELQSVPTQGRVVLRSGRAPRTTFAGRLRRERRA